MRISVVIILCMLISAVAGAGQAPSAGGKLTGRWRVSFGLNGDPKKNLIFETKEKGEGAFYLLDTGPDNKPVPDLVPVTWRELTNSRVSFSGEVELPLGTCCREFGTLMFKGKFESADSIKGTLVFVTSVDEEESPYKFHSAVGTFTATRVANKGE
jgi:hypothetical protein